MGDYVMNFETWLNEKANSEEDPYGMNNGGEWEIAFLARKFSAETETDVDIEQCIEMIKQLNAKEHNNDFVIDRVLRNQDGEMIVRFSS